MRHASAAMVLPSRDCALMPIALSVMPTPR